mmetsp:Transcript_8047/g.15234  ORF Transcript_8047/g.15234 Transcript_8047/m.15234 type:complete len:85 (-) Transcript_8047:50-304(-)
MTDVTRHRCAKARRVEVFATPGGCVYEDFSCAAHGLMRFARHTTKKSTREISTPAVVTMMLRPNFTGMIWFDELLTYSPMILPL